jgi:hypothetical protein
VKKARPSPWLVAVLFGGPCFSHLFAYPFAIITPAIPHSFAQGTQDSNMDPDTESLLVSTCSALGGYEDRSDNVDDQAQVYTMGDECLGGLSTCIASPSLCLPRHLLSFQPKGKEKRRRLLAQMKLRLHTAICTRPDTDYGTYSCLFWSILVTRVLEGYQEVHQIL